MLITDKFVFVHQPKTGGTFVRHVIDGIARAELGPPLGRLRRAGILPRRFGYRETPEYHDTCHDIPVADRGKPIVSVIRDPFDFYVSFYHYGWWAAHPDDSYRDFDAVKRAFPNFPDLSFDQFLDLANRFFRDFDDLGDPAGDHRLGYFSAQFLLFFFRDPKAAYAAFDDAFLNLGKWREAMYPVEFLRTGSLNRDLHAFLDRAGYPRRYIDPFLDKAPVRPSEHFTPRPSARFKDYYCESSYELVRDKERLLFTIFPDLGAVDRPYAEWRAD